MEKYVAILMCQGGHYTVAHFTEDADIEAIAAFAQRMLDSRLYDEIRECDIVDMETGEVVYWVGTYHNATEEDE